MSEPVAIERRDDALSTIVGEWRPKTYAEEAGDMSYRLMLDIYCGGSRVTIREGRLVAWRLERAKRRASRRERRRLAAKARRRAVAPERGKS